MDINMRVRIAIIICILIGSINLAGLYLVNTSSEEKLMQAEAGILSLEGWDEEGSIRLGGEWEFYPNALIYSEKSRDVFQEYSKQKRLVSRSEKDLREIISDPSITKGTFRLVIRLKDDNLYGINVGSSADGISVYVNGIQVCNYSQRSSLPGGTSFIYQTPVGIGQSQNGQFELVIHVADIRVLDSWISGAGAISGIEFGSADYITKMRSLSISLDMFVISGYLVLGIFFLGNYIFENKARYALFFSMFLLLQALHTAGIGERLIFLVLPAPKDYMLFYEYEIQLLYLYTFCFLMFLYDFLRPYTSKKAVVFLSVLLLLVGPVFNWELFGISELPGITNYAHKLIISGTTAISNIYILWVMLKALIKGVEAAEYVMVFTVTFFYYIVTRFLDFLFDINIGKIPALLVLTMVVILTLYLNYRLRLSYRQVDQLSRQLLLKDQDKDLLLARASLEIEKPVSEILMVSEKLLAEEDMPVQQREEKLRRVYKEGWQAYTILKELAETFGEPIKQEDLVLEPVDADCFTELLEELNSLVPWHGLPALGRKLPEQFPVFLADRNRLKEVLYHLLGNAAKFTDHGEITVRINSVENMAHITVEDTGAGIGSAQLNMVFAAFYQEKRPGQETGGLGLGLTVAKKLVQLMGGELWAVSEAGKGSAFTVSLLLAGAGYEAKNRTKNKAKNEAKNKTKDEEGDEAADKESLPAIGEKAEIALVPKHRKEPWTEGKAGYHPDKSGRKVILAVGKNLYGGEMLEWLGETLDYVVTAVDSAREALGYVARSRVDLVLISLHPSDMSGYGLCRKLRGEYNVTELPIIILGEAGHHEDLRRSFQAGASDFMSKPVVWEELKERIRIRLSVKKAAEETVIKELKNLHAQIMPHFLYNTLNTITALSYKDTEKTCEALQYLSVYFRAKLDFSGNSSVVSLDQELELVKAYLAIEKMRFNERLEIIYEIDETVHFMIPSLTLQPLVENAVHHGIIGNNARVTIRISIQRDSDRGYIIKISDDGPGIPEEKQQELLSGDYQRIGFSNVLKKIRLLQGADLWLESGEEPGTCVAIYISKEVRYGNQDI